jgi:hypothetical protein
LLLQVRQRLGLPHRGQTGQKLAQALGQGASL